MCVCGYQYYPWVCYIKYDPTHIPVVICYFVLFFRRVHIVVVVSLSLVISPFLNLVAIIFFFKD